MDLNTWLGIASGRFATALYIFARFGALFNSAPLISSKSVPPPVRVGLSGVLALTLMPLAGPSPVGSMPILVVGVAKELLLGLVLGWTATLFFSCAQMAGEWLDLQSGFQASQLVNPAFDTHNALLGNLSYWLAVLVFLGSGSYAILLRAAVRSLAVSPPGVLRLNLGLTTAGVGDWTSLVAQVIWIALQLAAPVAAALFLAEIAVGFITRAMPQMNVMMLTLPAKAGLALGALALSIPGMARALEVAFGHMGVALDGIVRGMGS